MGPEICWDEARQMTDVRRCNDQVCSGDIQCECLSRYQHITIQLFRTSRWYASVTRLSPEFGGKPQCHVSQGKVAISPGGVEGIQLRQSLRACSIARAISGANAFPLRKLREST
jgi:hypothetical protein